MKVQIGVTEQGKQAFLDIDKVIEQRLLITATSGGGKSWTGRSILELTDTVVPRIVLDPEGEFSSLREKYPFVLAGKGKDVPADRRTAATLARKALELNLNLIVDLYELPHAEKHEFVKLFLEALLAAPKNLWRPRILMIDEAHKFIPENGEGSSVAKPAGIQLLDSGRKRGLGTILATQRLAKLSKDAAAECWNKMIGPTAWDDDRVRAAKETGISQKDRDIFRTLKPGQFIMAGPALFQDPTKVFLSPPKTNHPKAGLRARAGSSAPSAQVKAVLAKLADLPKEAERELKTEADLRAEISRLQKELREAKRPQLGVPVELSEKALAEMKARYQKQVEKITVEMDRRRIQAIRQAFAAMKTGASRAIGEAAAEIEAKLPELKLDVTMAIHDPAGMKPPTLAALANAGKALAEKPSKLPPPAATQNPGQVRFGPCERAIAGFLSTNPDRTWSRPQVGLGSGYSQTSSGFDKALSRLRVAGVVTGSGKAIGFNLQRAQELLGSLEAPANARDGWKRNLGQCELELLKTLEANPTNNFTREELCGATVNPGTGSPYSPGSSGVDKAISRLNVLQMIIKDNGRIRLNPETLEV